MNRSRLGSCPHLVAPFLMMLFSFALSMHDPSIDPMQIVDSIQQGSRTVLLLSPLSKHVLVIVSSPGSTTLDDGAIVFDQPRDTLTDITMQLTYSAQYFRDKWPKLSLSADSLCVLRDQSYEYLAISFSQQLQMVNLETGGDIINKSIPSKEYNDYFGTGRTLLLSSQVREVYSYFAYAFTFIDRLQYPGSDMVSYEGAPYKISESYTANFDQGRISFDCRMYITVPGTTTTERSAYLVPVYTYWIITAGYITDSFVFLVNRNGSSIIKFVASVLGGGTCSITSIPFTSYWINPPPLPPPTLPPTSPPTLSPSKASLAPSKPSTSLSHVHLFIHTHHHLALIIIIGAVLGALLLAALIFYLLRKRASNAKQAAEQALAANEKMPKGDGKGGSRSKVGNRKSSKRSGKGRASKGATASKVENGQHGGLALAAATKPEHEPVASNQRILKLSRRRGGSLKKTLSKPHPVSAGKVHSTRRSSLTRQGSIKRGASLGKAATPHHASSKGKSSIKRRTSGKAATPGKAVSPHHIAPGKTATPHHASSKRKDSLKRCTSGKASIPGAKH